MVVILSLIRMVVAAISPWKTSRFEGCEILGEPIKRSPGCERSSFVSFSAVTSGAMPAPKSFAPIQMTYESSGEAFPLVAAIK
jgi:hypothetical protein